MSGTYKDLKAWQLAMELADGVYEVTEQFPRRETYGLASQMQRAAVSVASNIAEGKGRATDRDFARFLYQSRGSLHELETQLLIARRRKYVAEEQFAVLDRQIQELGRVLNGLISAIEAHHQLAVAAT